MINVAALSLDEDGKPHNVTELDDTTVYFRGSRFSLMQFTGLHDKNGKEIYEGDIVAAEDRRLSSIEWEAPHYIVRHHPEGGSDFLAGKKLKFEVIGNIYENPDQISAV